MDGQIYVGGGGWTFEPWRGVFYPDGLPQKRELEFASRALTSIEINGTYYSAFKRDSWEKWRDEPPDGFVFSVKASRFCAYRKELSSGEDLEQGGSDKELDQTAAQVRAWAKRGDVFAYFISGAKVRNPAAAQALIAKLKYGRPPC